MIGLEMAVTPMHVLVSKVTLECEHVSPTFQVGNIYFSIIYSYACKRSRAFASCDCGMHWFQEQSQ